MTLFVQNRRPRIYDKLCPRTRILPAPSIICPWSWSLTTDEVGPSRGRTVKHKIVRELVGIALGGFRVFDADLVCLAGHAFGCFQIALSLVERTEAARHLDDSSSDRSAVIQEDDGFRWLLACKKFVCCCSLYVAVCICCMYI